MHIYRTILKWRKGKLVNCLSLWRGDAPWRRYNRRPAFPFVMKNRLRKDASTTGQRWTNDPCLLPFTVKSNLLPQDTRIGSMQKERYSAPKTRRHGYVCVYMDTREFPWLDVRGGMPKHMCRSWKRTSNDVSHLPPQDRDLLLCPHYMHRARWSVGFWGFSCLQLLCLEKSQDHRSSSYSSWCTWDLKIRTQVHTHWTISPAHEYSFLFWFQPFLIAYPGGSSDRGRAAQWRDSQVQKWNLLPAIIWVKSEMDPQATVKPSDETTKDTFAASEETWGGAARFPNSYSVEGRPSTWL